MTPEYRFTYRYQLPGAGRYRHRTNYRTDRWYRSRYRTGTGTGTGAGTRSDSRTTFVELYGTKAKVVRLCTTYMY